MSKFYKFAYFNVLTTSYLKANIRVIRVKWFTLLLCTISQILSVPRILKIHKKKQQICNRYYRDLQFTKIIVEVNVFPFRLDAFEFYAFHKQLMLIRLRISCIYLRKEKRKIN